MCDGLSEFSLGDGKVSAVPISSLSQGTDLLSNVSLLQRRRKHDYVNKLKYIHII